MFIVSAEEAVALVQDGDTILIGGSGGGHAVPESLIVALERRFRDSGRPQGLSLVHPVGLGDGKDQGVWVLLLEARIGVPTCATPL